jgi:hypothetical protein
LIVYAPFGAAGFAVRMPEQLVWATHAPAWQTPVTQSLFAPQPTPTPQVGAQAGAAHLPFVQTPEPQSLFAPQPVPVVQSGAHKGAMHAP